MYRLLTNRELSNFRKFVTGIPLREFGQQGAFDAKPSRRASDEEEAPSEGRSAIDILLALQEKMSPEGFKALCMQLCDEGAEDEDEETFESPMDRELTQTPGGKFKSAMDEPEPFKGLLGRAVQWMPWPSISSANPAAPRPINRSRRCTGSRRWILRRTLIHTR
jgi:hypothetical protein